MAEATEGGGPPGEGDVLQRRPIYPRPPAASGGSAAGSPAAFVSTSNPRPRLRRRTRNDVTGQARQTAARSQIGTYANMYVIFSAPWLNESRRSKATRANVH